MQIDLNTVNTCTSPFKALHTPFHLTYIYKTLA